MSRLEFAAERQMMTAMIDREMERDDLLSLPRLLRWRFLMRRRKAELFAREFMRLLCLLKLSNHTILIPRDLAHLLNWFHGHPEYAAHVSGFGTPLPTVGKPMGSTGVNTGWRYTLAVYEEAFGTPPPPGIWTLQRPRNGVHFGGRIMGIAMVIAPFAAFSISLIIFAAMAFAINDLTLWALLSRANYEPSAAAAANIAAAIFFLASFSAAAFLAFLSARVPPGHPIRHILAPDNEEKGPGVID